MISANLVDVLILTDPIDTPWTNTTLYGVPGVPFYVNKTRYNPTILATESAAAFANAMDNMDLSISYDYAIAFMKY